MLCAHAAAHALNLNLASSWHQLACVNDVQLLVAMHSKRCQSGSLHHRSIHRTAQLCFEGDFASMLAIF